MPFAREKQDLSSEAAGLEGWKAGWVGGRSFLLQSIFTVRGNEANRRQSETRGGREGGRGRGKEGEGERRARSWHWAVSEGSETVWYTSACVGSHTFPFSEVQGVV